MIAELIIGIGCIGLGFYAIHKMKDNCILIVYRRDKDSGVTTRGGGSGSHLSFNRTIRDALSTLRERGSLNINVGSRPGTRGGIDGSHNWAISRFAPSRSGGGDSGPAVSGH